MEGKSSSSSLQSCPRTTMHATKNTKGGINEVYLRKSTSQSTQNNISKRTDIQIKITYMKTGFDNHFNSSFFWGPQSK